MPLQGVNGGLSSQRYGSWSMLCNGSLMSEDGFVRPCLVTITGGTNLGILFVLAHDYRWRWYEQVYQLPPYSGVVHSLDSHRNTKGFILFYFLVVVALGVLLCIDCFMAAWHTSWPRVRFWLAGGSCFWWRPFQVSRIFQGKTFWFLAFLFSLLHLLFAIGFFDSLSCTFCS